LTKNFTILIYYTILIYNEADMVLGYPPKEKGFVNKINPFRSLTGERALYRKDIPTGHITLSKNLIG